MTTPSLAIPATPITGTADTAPLVSPIEYATVSGDTATTSIAAAAALADALDMVQRRIRRTLLYAQYVERLALYRNGTVFPSATPLDITKTVNSPNGSPPEDVGVFQGDGIWVGWYVPLPSLPMWTGVVPPQTDITYWGGFIGATSTSGVSQVLPAELRRLICKVAWYLCHPITLPGTPGGVKSMSVGGISVTGDLSILEETDPGIRRALRRWTRPNVKGWGAQPTPS